MQRQPTDESEYNAQTAKECALLQSLQPLNGLQNNNGFTHAASPN